MASNDITPWTDRLVEVEALLAADLRLAALVGRTADRLFDLGGKTYRWRGHDADGVATDLRNSVARLSKEATSLRLTIDFSNGPERSLEELWSAVLG